MKIDSTVGDKIYELCEKLFPICRSITGNGVRETLDICDRAYIVNSGSIIAEGNVSKILNDETVKRVYLGHDTLT